MAMSENEAIKNINALNAVCWDKDFYDEEFAKAMAKAVKALHEIQQYRAIGTVEEFRKLRKMFGDDFSEMSEVVKRILKEYPEYQSIGTIEELQALKEKNEPKMMDGYYCPICRHYFEDGELHLFCPCCGQKLDWQ